TTKDQAMTTATLPATDLVDAFDQVLPAAGTDPEQPHLMGVLVEGKEGSIRLVATDRYRLAIRDLVPSTLTEDFSAVVPAATLQRWRSELGSVAELLIGLDHKDLTVAAEGIDLAAPRLPTTFPDYQQFLEPMAEATTVLVARPDLLGVVRRFDAREDAIEVLAGADGLVLRRGEDEQQVAASIDGVSQRIGINPRFLADAVDHAVGPEVTIEISSPTDPVVVRSADDGTYVSMIMPYSLD
ncbi:MAG: DNA polymerase III subunit beta, partial [Actinomycetota bacterium]